MTNDSDTERNKNNDLFQMINLVHVTPVNRALTDVVRKWQRVGVGEEEKTEYDLRRESYFRKLNTSKTGKADPELNIVPPSGLSGPGEGYDIVTLYELIPLSKNPLYNRLLWLKPAELENGLLKDDIRAFEDKWKYYLDKLFRCIGLEVCIKNGRPWPYWFVWTRFAPGDWGMTKIDPWPPAYEYFKEVLPPKPFRLMTDTPVDPETVVEASFKLPYPLGKKLDVLWVRYSPNCIMGVVRERTDEWKRLLTAQKDIIEGDPELKGAAYYNVLFDLFRRDEEVPKTFITTFMTDVAPRLKERESKTRPEFARTSY